VGRVHRVGAVGGVPRGVHVPAASVLKSPLVCHCRNFFQIVWKLYIAWTTIFRNENDSN
jgi:hypothetical protein